MSHPLPEYADDMFCFATYNAAHVINRAYTPLLKPLGLTYPQYITLTLLWETDGQSVGQLAKQLMMESSTLTPLIKRLESLGHVSRHRGLRDERQVFVRLTQSGRELKHHAADITACMIAGTGMKIGDLQSLVFGLRKLTQNLVAAQDTKSK
ncbi:MarR family transcriptional regulator [Aliisedimentitalea scapharcae]|uniref:MarR family transcriptional regulator n=1 Tax=Aliisedimentitalea scapharcae TaxID=1524259 RepID=A0ABZ2XNA6_9RHOB